MSIINFDKLIELSDGDKEFQKDLAIALAKGLKEFNIKYLESGENHDFEGIKNIRHKFKPSLLMFEIFTLQQIMIEGKQILEENGFGELFSNHMFNFQQAIKASILEMDDYLKNQNFLNA
jgi:hypothetical protein